MCVTTGPAVITGTRVYGYVPPVIDEIQRHICGYQNQAETSGPNCMLLNFAGDKPQLVRGADLTESFMEDMTRELPELVYVPRYRGGASRGFYGVTVESYGDYTVVLADGPADILGALEKVPTDRRPARTKALEEMVDFYMRSYQNDSFVLACFNGNAKPTHPIVVSYLPRDPSVITIPGLDGHDGKLPTIGARVYRDFRVAFGVHGVELPFAVRYADRVDPAWAPRTVTGFHDNREDGPNGNYVMPIEAITAGLSGTELAASLQLNDL